MQYGIDNEPVAVAKYVSQNAARGVQVEVRECGLFVDVANGQLAASPDRLAVRNGECIVLEVKCLSASRALSPLPAVSLKQNDGSFTLKMVNDGITLKEKHAWYYQVQMQMAITKIHKAIVIIFTAANHDVYECSIDFDNQFWESSQDKLLNHSRDRGCKQLLARDRKHEEAYRWSVGKH